MGSKLSKEQEEAQIMKPQTQNDTGPIASTTNGEVYAQREQQKKECGGCFEQMQQQMEEHKRQDPRNSEIKVDKMVCHHSHFYRVIIPVFEGLFD
jgi:hypothetical protein